MDGVVAVESESDDQHGEDVCRVATRGVQGGDALVEWHSTVVDDRSTLVVHGETDARQRQVCYEHQDTDPRMPRREMRLVREHLVVVDGRQADEREEDRAALEHEMQLDVLGALLALDVSRGHDTLAHAQDECQCHRDWMVAEERVVLEHQAH